MIISFYILSLRGVGRADDVAIPLSLKQIAREGDRHSL